MKNIVMLVALLGSASALSSDRSLIAEALSGAGEVNLKIGKTQSAKDLFYKALANDEGCLSAEYNLGLIFEKEGDKNNAISFFYKVISHQEASNKKALAIARLKILDPFFGKLALILDDYSRSLDDVSKRSGVGSALIEEVAIRASSLKEIGILPESRLPVPPAKRIVPEEIEKIDSPIGVYVYRGPWWTSDFEIKKDKTFMRIPIMIGGTWIFDEKTNTLHLTHSDGTRNTLSLTKSGFSNSSVVLTRKNKIEKAP